MSLTVLDTSAVETLIERFAEVDLAGNAAVFVLGFEAIRDRSGRRWAMRQDSVREFVERRFQKYFPPNDLLVRLDDVHFLVAQPLESVFGAQARALKLLNDVLQFFLGASIFSDVRLSRVTRIGPDGVEIAPVEVSDADLNRLSKMEWDDPSQNIEAQAHSDQDAAPTPSGGPVMQAIDAGEKPGAGVIRGDRNYEAVFLIEPIWSIKQRAVVSYLMRPLIFERQGEGLVAADMANATPGDLLRLDLIVLAEAARLFREHGVDKRFVLHVPLHHASLGATNGRLTLLSALKRLPMAASSIVVVVTGLDAGTPHSRIVALTSALAGQCRAVVALAPDLECKIDRWRDAHLSGVAVDLNVLANASEHLNVKRMSDFGARFQGLAPALMAYSVPNRAVLLMAWSAGFTHVGGELIEKYSKGILQPLRLDPIDLYQEKT